MTKKTKLIAGLIAVVVIIPMIASIWFFNGTTRGHLVWRVITNPEPAGQAYKAFDSYTAKFDLGKE